MLNNIKKKKALKLFRDIAVNAQSSIKIKKEKNIYFDPYKMDKESHDADIVFITHAHTDHFSIADINKICSEKTILIMPASMHNDAEQLKKNYSIENIILCDIYSELDVQGLHIKTIPAYNQEKQYHPKNKRWLGYVINLNKIKIYVAGDTDALTVNENIDCDIAILPIDGKYTMSAEESAEFCNKLKPEIVIPTHYTFHKSREELIGKFYKNLSETIICTIKLT